MNGVGKWDSRLRELVGGALSDSRGYVVYRHYDRFGELLYVGQTERFAVRQAQHLQGSRWRGDIARIEFNRYPSREIMAIVEAYLIETLLPWCNGLNWVQ
jgi:excinuclease UvrABC nuclease subunit